MKQGRVRENRATLYFIKGERDLSLFPLFLVFYGKS